MACPLEPEHTSSPLAPVVQYVRCPISTLCIGQAASMASLLLTAGDKGQRFVLPHARIMLHQPLGAAEVGIVVLLAMIRCLGDDFKPCSGRKQTVVGLGKRREGGAMMQALRVFFNLVIGSLPAEFQLIHFQSVRASPVWLDAFNRHPKPALLLSGSGLRHHDSRSGDHPDEMYSGGTVRQAHKSRQGGSGWVAASAAYFL